jgi:hypothetical protein
MKQKIAHSQNTYYTGQLLYQIITLILAPIRYR